MRWPGRMTMVVKAAPLLTWAKWHSRCHLLKPGRLTTEEFEIMKTHPQIGADAITRAMEQSLAGADDEIAELAGGALLLNVAYEISLGHQEKWDGSGYPGGLVGEAIPVSARLMALAQAFSMR